MMLSMLGSDFKYGFAPVSGGYLRANGSGYVRGLGETTARSASDAALAWSGSHQGKVPASINDPAFKAFMNEYNSDLQRGGGAVIGANAVLDELKKLYRAGRVERFSSTTQSILDLAAKGTVTIATAIAQIKGLSVSEDEKDRAINSLGFKQYMPWIIGGSAVLVAMFFLMGTRRKA